MRSLIANIVTAAVLLLIMGGLAVWWLMGVTS